MKIMPATLAATTLVGLSLLASSPASAAGNAVDPGDSVHAIACDDGYTEWQLFGGESTTAFSTPIGVGNEGSGTPVSPPGPPAPSPALAPTGSNAAPVIAALAGFLMVAGALVIVSRGRPV